MKRRQFTAALGVLSAGGTGLRPGRRLAPAHRARRLPVHAGRLAGQHRPAARAPSSATISASPSSSTTAPARAARSPPTTSPSRRPTAIRCCWAISAATPGAAISTPSRPTTPSPISRRVAWIGTQPNLLCCHPELPARHRRQADRRGQGGARQVPVRLAPASAPRRRSPWSWSSRRPAPISPSSAYRGASAAAADVLAGHVPMCIANIDSLMGQVNAGKLKPIATTGAQRSPVRPTRRPSSRRASPTSSSPRGRCGRCRPGTPAKIKEKLQARAPSGRCKEPDVIDEHAAGRLRARHHVGGRGRRLHQGRVQALGRGDPCRGHQAAIGISVPDLLAPGLDLVFCGTAPSPASFKARAYYANPGNAFWPTLHAVGLTPERLAPAALSRAAGAGHRPDGPQQDRVRLGPRAERRRHGRRALHAKLRRSGPPPSPSPASTPPRSALGVKAPAYGRQAELIEGAVAFVLASPSGRARSFWTLSRGARWRPS